MSKFRKMPLGARWIGPWVKSVPGFVATTRNQAEAVRAAVPGAELLCSLRRGRWHATYYRVLDGLNEFLFFARAEDLVSAGMPAAGRGWRTATPLSRKRGRDRDGSLEGCGTSGHEPPPRRSVF